MSSSDPPDDVEVMFPQPAEVGVAWSGLHKEGQKHRAFYAREVFKGWDDSGLFRVRDIYMFGPYREKKVAAVQDAQVYVQAYASGGIDALRQASREMFRDLPENFECHRPLGWEVEVETTSAGLKQARAVCHCGKWSERGELMRVQVEGPWRSSRGTAEKDMNALLKAFEQQGLDGMQTMAELTKKTAVPPTVFQLPAQFAIRRACPSSHSDAAEPKSGQCKSS